ncbi:hypothetical protein [Rheinheimera sp.]|uniref:hypothetical protein n=1 Tax=Rheinheimera sp. TaxID=1869214 RepID=UPI00307FC757
MWGKSTAAAFCGLPLTVAIIGIIALLLPGAEQRWTMSWLLLSFPLWVGLMSLAFLCQNGKSAWKLLLGLTIVCYGLLHGLKLLLGSAG